MTRSQVLPWTSNQKQGGNDDDESGLATAMIRTMPTCKVARKEYAKLQQALPGSNNNQNGLFAPFLQELIMFQHVHYMNNSSLGSQYVIQPLGIVHLSLKKGNNEKAGTSDPAAHEELAILRLLSSSTNNTNQKATSSEGIEKLLKYMLIPGCVGSLDKVLHEPSATSATASKNRIPHFLRLQWCKELLLAMDHLHYCGIVLKWLDEEHVLISSDGSIKISNLHGAEMMFSDRFCPSASHHIEDGENMKTPKKDKKGSKRDKDQEPSSNRKDDINYNSSKEKVSIPTSCLNKVAPEIIFGQSANMQSSLYAIGILCAWIFTQKPLIKVSYLLLLFVYLSCFIYLMLALDITLERKRRKETS